jgi:hypothetical protein
MVEAKGSTDSESARLFRRRYRLLVQLLLRAIHMRTAAARLGRVAGNWGGMGGEGRGRQRRYERGIEGGTAEGCS